MDDPPPPTHVIRLHAAWQRIEHAADTIVAERRFLSLPDNLPIDPAATAITYVRKFNLPTGLSGTDRVSLASELLKAASVVKLNGVLLDVARDQSVIDITDQLHKHNEIAVHLACEAIDTARRATAALIINAS